MPPSSTRQSCSGCLALSWSMAAARSRPSWCVPSSTRTGPFAALHGSRWCQTTFQFAEGVLSKRSARTAKHEAPKTDVASARSCEFVASYGLQSAQGRHGPDDGRPATPHDERDAAHRRSEEFGARLHQRLWINFNDPEARHVFGRDRGRLPFRHSPPACSMSRPASGAHLP